MAKKYRNWEDELARFEAAKVKTRKFEMGSAGSAQVTRTRLISQFDTRVKMRTQGATLIFEK